MDSTRFAVRSPAPCQRSPTNSASSITCAYLRAAAQRLQLSARAFHRVLKLARTIADLAEAETIAAPQLAEALQYRPRVDVG
jgi:predicted ATPase with chaperone activity